ERELGREQSRFGGADPRLRHVFIRVDHHKLLVLVSQVESAFGAKPIRVLTYRPVTSDGPLPVIVHIHGGGFVMGAPEIKDVENRLFASELRCAIYSVDHRLAPEAPHPAPLEDIYSVFAWLHANAGQLGLDPARIGIK